MEANKIAKMSPIRERLDPDTLLQVMYEGDDSKPRFCVAYWSIRGLAAPLRAMMSAAQVNHEAALYDLTEDAGTGWEMKKYAADKKWLKEEVNPFMNLPFLVDTEKNIVVNQTNAIFQYLANELGMSSKDPVEQAKIDEMLCETMDFRDKMVHFVYQTTGSLEDAQTLLNGAKAHLRKFEAHFAKTYPNKKDINHLIPGKFTAPDFHLWEMLDQYDGLGKKYGLPLWEDKEYPCLEDFRANFPKLPENAPYMDSYLHKELPFNNCSGSFGSSVENFDKYTRGQEAPWRSKGVVRVTYKKTSS